MKNIFLGLILLFAAAVTGAAQNSQIQAGTSLQAQLAQNLDVKNAKVGDQVILKAADAIKNKKTGETIVPKGANIIGRITEVRQQSKNNAGSKLSLIFDRIQGKNLDTPITASIISITKATGNANAVDTSDSNITGGSNSSGSVSRGNSGGGLLGGVGSAVGSVAGTTTGALGGVTETAGQTVGGATRTLGQTVNGIQISQSADASVNGATTLSAADKNLKLEKGMTFNLLVNESVKN